MWVPSDDDLMTGWSESMEGLNYTFCNFGN